MIQKKYLTLLFIVLLILVSRNASAQCASSVTLTLTAPNFITQTLVITNTGGSLGSPQKCSYYSFSDGILVRWDIAMNQWLIMDSTFGPSTLLAYNSNPSSPNPATGAYVTPPSSNLPPGGVITIALGNIPLSLNFGNIIAIKNNKYSTLEWQVSDEVHVKKYIVERAINGIDFYKIGEVIANQSENYSFTDKQPVLKNYYRIKSVDFDNSYHYSQIIELLFDQQDIFSLFPNPVNDILNFQIIGNEPFKIHNSVGLQVIKGKIIDQKISVKHLPKGIYYFISGDKQLKFQKQ